MSLLRLFLVGSSSRPSSWPWPGLGDLGEDSLEEPEEFDLEFASFPDGIEPASVCLPSSFRGEDGDDIEDGDEDENREDDVEPVVVVGVLDDLVALEREVGRVGRVACTTRPSGVLTMRAPFPTVNDHSSPCLGPPSASPA